MNMRATCCHESAGEFRSRSNKLTRLTLQPIVQLLMPMSAFVTSFGARPPILSIRLQSVVSNDEKRHTSRSVQSYKSKPYEAMGLTKT